jgi:hypothetical protein
VGSAVPVGAVGTAVRAGVTSSSSAVAVGTAEVDGGRVLVVVVRVAEGVDVGAALLRVGGAEVCSVVVGGAEVSVGGAGVGEAGSRVAGAGAVEVGRASLGMAEFGTLTVCPLGSTTGVIPVSRVGSRAFSPPRSTNSAPMTNVELRARPIRAGMRRCQV